jgi:DnaK suppressor protein
MATSVPKKSTPARSAAAKKSAAETSEPAVEPAKTPAGKTSTKRVAVKANENRTQAPAGAKTVVKQADGLTVRAGESPWSAAEMTELRSELERDAVHLKQEIRDAEQEIVGLLRDGGDGAGNDQADVGSTTLERDHEMSLANNARDMLDQIERALSRIDDGSYGLCESCSKPIGKGRLQAFPRATLCVSCKEREERR